MKNRSIPFFNYPYVFKSSEAKYMEIIKDVCSRGAFIMQKELLEFEENLARFVGAKYAVGVSNGSDAITMGLKAAGIQQGDEAIFSSHTFVATAAGIHYAGGVPVPVECGTDHEIDIAEIEKKITKKTKFIVPTQLNGRCAKMDELMALADRHGLKVVEDAAQALGAKFKGVSAGTFGATGSISFYPAKVVGCFGDAGAIFTNDEKIYESLMIQRDHGRSPKTGQVVGWGLNFRMDNLHAAILNEKLKYYPAVIEKRRHIAGLYNEYLKTVSALHLPPAPTTNGDHFDIFQNYEIEAEKRDELKSYLAENGVGTLIQWGGKAVHQLEGLGFKDSLPVTERIVSKMLMLPINETVSDEDVEYISQLIVDFYKKQ